MGTCHGCSSGIGKEFAGQIAASGINIVLVARREDLLKEVGVKFSKRFGVEHRVIVLDVSREDFIDPDDGPRESFHFDDFAGLRETRARRENYSERRACMTSTRAARAAGSNEATTAAPNNTNAETITGNAPGIFKSPK